MPKRLGLRIRFALFFAALGLGGTALFGLGLWLGHGRAGGPPDGYVIAWLTGSFGLLGLAAWIGLLFDENVARPILALAADLHTRAKSDVSAQIDAAPARYLGTLAPAAHAIHDALEEARASQSRLLEEKTARMARDKALLEALIRDLAEGVVVMSPDRRILLYNQTAVQVLGELGLDRPLERFLHLDPIEDAARRLKDRDGPASESFLTASASTSQILTGALSRVDGPEGPIGHVILLRDATEDLRTHGKLDGLLSTLIDETRRPSMALGAVLDVLDDNPTLPAEEVARFTTAMREEVARLSDAVSEVARKQARITSRHWPMRETAVADIFSALEVRHAPLLRPRATDLRLSCDGHAISAVLEKAVSALVALPERRGFDLGAEDRGDEILLGLTWDGPALPQAELEQLADRPLAEAYGAYTLRDALTAHRTDIWIEGSRVLLPLPKANDAPLAVPPERPDFYDFDLPFDGDGDQKLSELSFVVFDCETTGLDPAKDDVVQLAGVRVVHGRLVRGEEFNSLVNPGRKIPAASTAIHRITDEMVVRAPDVREAAALFAQFSEGAVLVAHNAPFDMAFLKRVEAAGGATFDHPVLCTARLSAAVSPHTGEHTLDALAERYDVQIEERLRHTALGDAVATAEVLLKMLPLLATRDVVTLGDALDLQSRWAEGARFRD